MYSTIRSRVVKNPSTSIVALASLIGGTGYSIIERKQFKAESDTSVTERWRGKPTVVTHNAAITDRIQKRDQENKTSSYDPMPPSQTKDHALSAKDNTDGDLTAWQTASSRIAAMQESVSSLDFSRFRDTIADLVLPEWAKMLPGMVKKFQDELSMAPWSLGWEIWNEAHDPQINPEIIWNAQVRLSADLCPEEIQFLKKRRVQTAKALARYLDLPEQDIDPQDVPTIAVCGSGGGLRALVAGTSSYFSTQEAGLFDCTTYMAGVSGSCWLQTLYFSSIGQTSFERMLNHFKARLDKHIAYPPAALQLLTQAPTNKFLLSGVVEKLKGVPDAEFGLVDVYGLLLAARLLVPRGELGVSDWDLKVSNQKYFVNDGDQPLPIYTAVRHEIPEIEEEHPVTGEITKKQDKQSDWFQWFEWTPYEFYSEELEAGIPTWSVGRNFMSGVNQFRENGLALPEIKVPLMMGIWGSAFCATLSHYYHEVSPILQAAGWSGLDSMLAQKDKELIKVHPLDPASIPNYVLGLKDKLPSTCPDSIHTASHLRLMDAGMSNNLPIYPLLRPGRDVDVIVAFDVSADAPIANWIKVVDGYAKQRKVKGWPMGAGWPPQSNSDEQTQDQMEKIQEASESRQTPAKMSGNLGHCTVWVGSTVERERDHSIARKMSPEDKEWHLTSDDSGIAIVYFPLIPNETAPGIDPQKSDYMSTWNFVYTPDEIDKVVALAKANYQAGAEQTRRVVRAVYERKKEARLEAEKREKELRRRLRMRRGEAIGKIGEGDHFS